ncbi:MAG: helix-hairpin-helix domain-containing protein [Candidatus Thorarchaeota archaeon]
MLEYREFPTRSAVCFLFFSPTMTYFFYMLSKILTGTLLDNAVLENMVYLGYGLVIAAITLLLTGVIADKVKRPVFFLYLGTLTPLVLGILYSLNLFTIEIAQILQMLWVFSIFIGLVLVMVNSILHLNGTVVIRFRGRVVGIFFAIALSLFTFYNYLESIGIALDPLGIPLPEVIALVCVICTAILKPWKKHQYPLAARGDIKKYFIPMVFILGSHLLWYYATQLNIIKVFTLANDSSFISLGQHSGLALYEPILLGIGAIIAGFISDIRGRKTAFSTAILLMGLLAIFSSTMYGIDSNTGHVILNSIPLLIMERSIEGFLLGLCGLLVWTELSMPKDKGKKISAVMLFFLSYMALFWGLQLGAFNLVPPEIISIVGAQFAVLLSLVALYLIGAAPKLLGREMEMEELALDFDDKMVSDTVDAFVGMDDFESIRSQLDIMDVSEDLSDDAFDEIVGDDFQRILPLRRIAGIGPRMEERLQEAGYISAAQLAGETAKRLAAKVDGLSEKRAERILSAARASVKKIFDERKSSR